MSDAPTPATAPEPALPAERASFSWLKEAYRRDKESLCVLAVGVLAYVAPDAAMRIGQVWLPELAEPTEPPYLERFRILRRKFWWGFAKAFAVATVALGVLALTGHHVRDSQAWMRIGTAILALTATLGRGGWEIQSYKNKTVVERIDRGMYLVGQLGAFALLVLILGW